MFDSVYPYKRNQLMSCQIRILLKAVNPFFFMIPTAVTLSPKQRKSFLLAQSSILHPRDSVNEVVNSSKRLLQSVSHWESTPQFGSLLPMNSNSLGNRFAVEELTSVLRNVYAKIGSLISQEKCYFSHMIVALIQYDPSRVRWVTSENARSFLV